jgi:hypothetical protein
MVHYWSLDHWIPYTPDNLPEMSIQVLLQKEFPYKDKHDTQSDNGCACRSTGESWIFIDGLLSEGNISILDLSEYCWHCKKANVEEVAERVHHYICSLDYDNWIAAYIDELTRVTVHELIHLCINDREERIKVATQRIAPYWNACRKYEPEEEPEGGAALD